MIAAIWITLGVAAIASAVVAEARGFTGWGD